jgi:ribonuclease HI
MSKKSKTKYYVVWVGQNPGIYDSWAKCQEQIKGFPNAKYKSFKTLEEAEQAFGQSATEHIQTKKLKEQKPKSSGFHDYIDEIVKNSISVDAACSGNPGVMEYRGVETLTGEELFKMGPFKGGTNNIGEFLALVHALAWLKQKNAEDVTIYTDSRTALSWLKNKKVKTTLQPNRSNKLLFLMIDKALNWLRNNDYKNTIIKWDTKRWGEIPADFGRK